MRTFHALLKAGQETLAPHTTDYRIDSEWLLCHVFHYSKAQLLARLSELSGSEDLEARYEALLAQRVSGVPLAYLVGEADFMGRVFQVVPGVLVPRPETAVLVEQVVGYLQSLSSQKPVRVLELGVGTGIVGISIALAIADITVVGWDISRKAIEVAQKNAEVLGASQVQFRHGDFFEGCEDYLSDAGYQKIIVSNPPYISDSVVTTLETSVRDHEPLEALAGGEDGLDYYRRLIQVSSQYGCPLCCEMGFDQREGITGLYRDLGLKAPTFFKDDQGLERVFLFQSC